MMQHSIKNSVKIILFIFSFCLTQFSYANNDTSISVTVKNITSQPSGYYCFDVYVGYDAEGGCHVPTRIGFGFINRYLIDIKTNQKNPPYLKFAYSSRQNTKQAINWLCKIKLIKSGDITVSLTPKKCTHTYQ